MSTQSTTSLEEAWGAFGHAAAAVTGALAGLIALLVGAGVVAACTRGALAWAAALAVGRGARWLLIRLQAAESGRVPATAVDELENDSTLKGSQEPGR